MKYLGIDYGSKRVGLAISDETGSLSFPLEVLENNKKTIEKILKTCKEKSVEVIIVGESKDFSMKDNPIMTEINSFADQLKRETEIPVYFHPEFLTSSEAERGQGKNDMIDASAAAIILKSFLDTQENGKQNNTN